jgi:signal transduction histidine kinase
MLIFAASVVLLLALVYWTTAGFMARQTDETIDIEIAGLDEQYRRQGLQGLAQIISERIRVDPDGSSIYLFSTDEFKVIAGNLDEWPPLVPAEGGWMNFTRTDGSGREVPARARLFKLRGGLNLLVGRDIRELVHTEALIRRGLIWGLAVATALGLLGGLLMSRRINSRIDVINRASREIMAGDLSRRIPERGTGDEFDELSRQLNSMLERIEELMQGVRHVADNIAHDLRTPLTRLRTRLELLRTGGQAATDTAEVEASIEQADQLLATFNALLRIARIESGGSGLKRAPVSLDRLVDDTVDLYQAVAEDRGIELTAKTVAATVSGDRDQLFQALTNLVDNGIKYTPPGGEVRISVARRRDEVCLEVRDTGPGVGDEHKNRVTRRFYRVDDSRGTPGNGLGLSLVQAVADQHRARLEFVDGDPGLVVRLCLPGGSS